MNTGTSDTHTASPKNAPVHKRLSKAARWRVLIAVMIAWLPIAMDMTILHIAVPSLTLSLQATGTEILWIIDIYPLIMASLLVPMGTQGDRMGPRALLLVGLAIFLVFLVMRSEVK